ncbi:hypothetical protein GO003_015615 [Methylicorpusculum oleiharenae]|uniref:hypothetical protein n=1 Tax=Methylicorpusculum oleiharenae TaxID=1338687 RepID=UPI00135BED87|nr:hypothetical protein [Methylicorpusculum oleiharenae]MCD2451815.1 hypothetical protein [Methylicorpusculum oleiharenae]
MEKIHTKTVVCMTTYDRIDCARINQEIIKLNYKRPLPIVHTCSSKAYQKHIEDVFLAREPLSLQYGALDLLNQSLKLAQSTFSPEYIIHLEGDTWIMNEHVIYNLITKMEQNKDLMICTSAWDEDLLAFKYLKKPSLKLKLQQLVAATGRKFGFTYQLACRDSLATQFFIIRAKQEVIDCFLSCEPIPGIDLEQALYRNFLKKFTEKNILRMKEREPIHPFNRYVTEKLTLFSQHWPARGTANDQREPTHPRYISPNFDGKLETLQRFPNMRKGEYLQKLLNAESLDYYNPGASRT